MYVTAASYEWYVINDWKENLDCNLAIESQRNSIIDQFITLWIIIVIPFESWRFLVSRIVQLWNQFMAILMETKLICSFQQTKTSKKHTPKITLPHVCENCNNVDICFFNLAELIDWHTNLLIFYGCTYYCCIIQSKWKQFTQWVVHHKRLTSLYANQVERNILRSSESVDILW